MQLVSEVQTIKAGESFWIGLDMVLEEHWHVYWKNPGDSGMPPKVSWGLPEGFKIGGTQYPYPERIDYDPLTSYVYCARSQ